MYTHYYEERPEFSQADLDLFKLVLKTDVSTLKDETRYLIQKGLFESRKSLRIGLRVMLEALEVEILIN